MQYLKLQWGNISIKLTDSLKRKADFKLTPCKKKLASLNRKLTGSMELAWKNKVCHRNAVLYWLLCKESSSLVLENGLRSSVVWEGAAGQSGFSCQNVVGCKDPLRQ